MEIYSDLVIQLKMTEKDIDKKNDIIYRLKKELVKEREKLKIAMDTLGAIYLEDSSYEFGQDAKVAIEEIKNME